MAERCETILAALASIASLAELEAFTDTLRKPPPGCAVKTVTDDEWRQIAQRKIAMQRTRP